jgi:3-dehydroquinate dehydratase
MLGVQVSNWAFKRPGESEFRESLSSRSSCEYSPIALRSVAQTICASETAGQQESIINAAAIRITSVAFAIAIITITIEIISIENYVN